MVKSQDKLQMYMGYDFVVNDKITIRQPTIGEIINLGEQAYWSVVHSICTIPSDMKSQLWDQGIDYEEITDFQLFVMLVRSLPLELTKILFGELNFQKFNVCIDDENGNIILGQELDDGTAIVIDEYLYLCIVEHLRKMHNIKPKIEKAANKHTKKILIDLDRSDRLAKKNKEYTSPMLPLISALCNTPGFKYKKTELVEINIVEFFDSVQRISAINTSTALLHGCYGGMINTTKINKDELNWAREL